MEPSTESTKALIFNTTITQLKKILHPGPSQSDEDPFRLGDSVIFRGELFSSEQLARHAEALASTHQLIPGRAREQLIPRLNDNEQSLLATYGLLAEAARNNRPLAPGAEWLLDNFYLIEEQIHAARINLPSTYGENLPRISGGTFVRFPRVFSLVLQMISHSDGKADSASLNGFVAAYQRVTPLNLGELWAVPIMLSLALIENLRRVGERVAAGYRDQAIAAGWADRMARVVELNPSDLILVMADMARAAPDMTGAFLAEITRHLRGKSPHFAFANGWLEHRVAAKGLTIEELVRAEGQAQAADQVSIGNCITSLRFLSSKDWRDFVEQHSVVEQILGTDPAGVHAGMNFATRNQYRQVIEETARCGNLGEPEIAERAVGLAMDASTRFDARDRRAHVGYYLIDAGLPELERLASARKSLREQIVRWLGRAPLMAYLSGIVLLSALVTLAFLFAFPAGVESRFAIAALTIPFLFCAVRLGIGLTNWLSTLMVRPTALPRMDFDDGIPAEQRTLVVVPTMISNPAVITSLLEGIEVRYLANRDSHLHFGILGDFDDAGSEIMPGDAALVTLVSEGIDRLNLKYAKSTWDLFFFFHRPRVWNPREGKWMGRERKRGKLLDLNDLLRGRPAAFMAIVGNQAPLAGVRYVITLDTDTDLPRDSAREMIGAMAHTLNRPLIDPVKGRVVTGYGIMQPRIGVSLPGSQKSWFVRLFAGESGIDPYTRVVSDVYQDLFGEGSFIGKGIYDVDAFVHCCASFPDNTILSHDLIESACARSGLLSDVELQEEFPTRYSADVSRRHRWMRGDWQLLAWLVQWLPFFSHRTAQKPISALSWWKIFDNLRRSWEPVLLLALLVGAWFLLSQAGIMSVTCFVIGTLTLVPCLCAIRELSARPDGSTWMSRCRLTCRSLGRQLLQSLVQLVFLPHEALISLDAIVRTMSRICWTGKNLLEWKTSFDAHHGARVDLAGFFRSMWFGPALAFASAMLLILLRPGQLPVAAPLIGLWLVSPVLAWWLSRTIIAKPVKLTETQQDFLLTLARKTWRYFEDFVTQEENWLPPDNVQDYPEITIAHRTSPTNIGMALLSDLAACDFGFCGAGRLLERTGKTLETLAKLQRCQGHFYNWYDTRTLEPLNPRYVSSVDSGNLAGALFVLRAGLLELADSPRRKAWDFDGLRITATLIADTCRVANRPDLRQLAGQLMREMRSASQSESDIEPLLVRLRTAAGEIAAASLASGEVNAWAKTFKRHCTEQHDELLMFSPWLAMEEPPRELRDHPDWESSRTRLESARSLRDVAGLAEAFLPTLDERFAVGSHPWIDSLRTCIRTASTNASVRIQCLERAAGQCTELLAVDFGFLFDRDRELFAVGYNETDHRRDISHYDLLASEARLTSYLAVAMGQVGQEHWFTLGRKVTATGGATALLSWSGSMFEYLMPLLVMPTYENTLLDQTYKAVVRRQINYGRQRMVPWGISESGYSTIDQHMVYQYRAFGVPGLGLKRGLVDDLVIAPYACALALMVDPGNACRNLERLTQAGQQGAYGLYEAIDYSPSRVSRGTGGVTVRQFMAHHQGMSLLALDYVLRDRPMQRRFESDPMLRAADLLLQERVPKTPKPIFPHVSESGAITLLTSGTERLVRDFGDSFEPTPEVQLLSNGRYHVVVSSSGGGYSRWRDLAVTRWREDATRDGRGSFCYIRDVEGGVFWSTTNQPVPRAAKRHSARFTQSRAEFFRSDERIDTNTEISVSPEDDVELRRMTITNRNKTARTIEVTSYAEVVLASQAQDLSHPAFSNLFVQTEVQPEQNAIFCTRRPRSAEETPPWLLHMMTVRGTAGNAASCETDRSKFIGRGRTLANPVAMDRPGPLSNSQGSVLDPVVSVRQSIRLEPGESVRLDLVTGMAETRDAIAAMMTKYADPNLADRVFELAWTHSQIQLRQLNISESDALLYCQMAGSVIYASSLRRAAPATLLRNRRGQSSLWSYGISGDLPIVLLRIRQVNRLELARHAIQAHGYWRIRGLLVDLVIWNEDDSVYHQSLQDSIVDLVNASSEAGMIDKPGGVFVRRGEQMAEEDRLLLLSVARVVLTDEDGSLAEQADWRAIPVAEPPVLVPMRRLPDATAPTQPPVRDLQFFNGLGGFSHDGREYVVTLEKGQSTPAPWVNVIANAHFGTVVSETGGAYSWAENSHEYRLTPWHNDPVSDTTGEMSYVRDEETGRFWSPTPGAARNKSPYVTRHGFGYSVFENTDDGITTELTVFVATDAPVKFLRLKVANRSGRSRKLSVTAYWEWTLGELRDKSLMHVVTETDADSGAIFARNSYSQEFSSRIAFADCSERTRTITGDRTEFLGRHGSTDNPAALRRTGLSGRTGAGYDPCAAIQSPLFLDDGQEKEVVFIMGAAGGHDEARSLLWRFRGVNNARRTLEGVWNYWNKTLGTMHCETPDPAVNFLANGWLIYQTLACRMWARTGFYQSGGAYGFRDQLQDAMALVHAEPGLYREQLLRAAGRQFQEGDVQHWWHPPAGRGVRTHFSDDYLWLPYATCRYVSATGDTGVLEERTPFLAANLLRPDEEAIYDLPRTTEETGSLYEHCLLALWHGLRFGEHGLPLIGCGDWNDGMNLVGKAGKGESVWLAFFLHDVLIKFSELARLRDDHETIERCTLEAGRLRGNIEAGGWDGAWYRRAYFDDGTPLGSAGNEECQIDSISQSWSVLSGAGTNGRMTEAMENLDHRLVRREAGLIQLLDPPFDKSSLNPGYIKGYVPGVRENGGQYTHAAIWAVMAFAKMGDNQKAWELFRLINPILHGNSTEKIAVYRAEPYVVAADVYAVAPHTGRGGWTWYTGSSGWMYRLITESLLGIRLDVDKLWFEPCLPNGWTEFKVHYRHRETIYHITLRCGTASQEVTCVTMDGRELTEKYLPLADDHVEHQVTVRIG